MNFLDLLIGVPLLWYAYKGFGKGLIAEITSLVALIAGIYIAVHFSWLVGGYLESLFSMDNQYLSLASFAVTFIMVVVLAQFLGLSISRMLQHIALGFINKLAGGVFGLLKIAFIISVILYFYCRIDENMHLIPEEIRSESLLFKPVAGIAPVVIPKLEKEKEKAKEIWQSNNIDKEKTEKEE